MDEQEGKRPLAVAGMVDINCISSGKSSLRLTILRLLKTPSGSPHIYMLDLSSIPRSTIGFHLTTLSQDPLKPLGAVRDNPNYIKSIKSDNVLVSALTKVNLWGAITTGGGLDADFDTPSVSHGQQQLFCLAHALFHRCKVVLLDEGNSSVDRQTEEEVQKVILSELVDCTMLGSCIGSGR